jgi:hypothetical protein
LSEVLQRQISLKQIYEIFQKIFTYYQLENDWKIEQKEEFKNFSVNFSQKTLCIPGNLESLSLKRLLELIDHEICVHLIR